LPYTLYSLLLLSHHTLPMLHSSYSHDSYLLNSNLMLLHSNYLLLSYLLSLNLNSKLLKTLKSEGRQR